MFRPLFVATKQALSSERLLPSLDGGHVPAKCARLARTQELRTLLTSAQLAELFGEEHGLFWVSSEITQDRTPELRGYLLSDLGVPEVTPETILSKLDRPFLESQTDAWILDLYQFLNGQRALRRRLTNVPTVRLEDGTHIFAHVDGQPQAFLPGAIKTGFPTVRPSVCETEDAREFLQSLGLTEPDPVDDVIRNVLPEYRMEEVRIDDADYQADIRRILIAFDTDSKLQREKLVSALRETAFVKVVDTGDGSLGDSRPGDLYLPTERLKELFHGVSGVHLIDDTYTCLRGENVRELLEACGAVRYLRPITDATLSWEEQGELRVQAGHPQTSGQKDRITDWTLSGLEELLEMLPRVGTEQRRTKAELLWNELAHLEERRGKGVFTGRYTWTHYGSYEKSFDAAFVRLLNSTAWIPDANGDLRRAEFILFDTLGWKLHPFLQSRISFKPPLLDELAKEAGVEPGLIELLKKLGVTSEAVLRERLGLEEEPTGGVKPVGPEGHSGATPGGGGVRPGTDSGQGKGRTEGSALTGQKTAPGGQGGRPFISYVGVRHDDAEADPDGLDQAARMALEEAAIGLILSREPHWRRTAPNNPGFDLDEADEYGKVMRWCEVKAMTGGLRDRPVGLSRRQFECAHEQGEAYWLYVVEHAGSDNARIVRIQDPGGKARTFTFDHGWVDVAEVDGGQEGEEH